MPLGYLAGYSPAAQHTGVTVFDPKRAQQGLNLYISGHKPEAVLIDMDGAILHTWSYAFDDLPPDILKNRLGILPFERYWRRVFLFDNGDLLAIFDYTGLIKLDKDSHLLWLNPEMAHHDLQVLENGEILILALSTSGSTIPGVHNSTPISIREDLICRLDPQGRTIERLSLAACLQNSPYAYLLKQVDPQGGDIFHTNSIQVLDGSLAGRDPAFKKGNILVSLMRLHTIAVVDPAQRSVVWAIQGPWRFQHEPQVLPNGHMIVFDNVGYNGCSRVMEFDPFTHDAIWQYTGSPPESFQSAMLGDVQRLPNGNTLVTDSCSARAFEVTSENQVVWEFVNPARIEKDGQTIAATLFEVKRLPPDFPMDWMNGKRAPAH